jgi:hypothetical protein
MTHQIICNNNLLAQTHVVVTTKKHMKLYEKYFVAQNDNARQHNNTRYCSCVDVSPLYRTDQGDPARPTFVAQRHSRHTSIMLHLGEVDIMSRDTYHATTLPSLGEGDNRLLSEVDGGA